MTTHTISVKDFSTTPAGRFISDGPASGERFRNEVLAPAFSAYDIIEIDLNGVFGFGSSFLDEAFGGMVRKRIAPKDDILRRLKIKTPLKTYETKVLKYIKDARPD